MGRIGIGASHKKLLLTTTMLVSALGGYGRRAYGACAPNPSPRFECSGDASTNLTTQTIDADDAEVVTLPFFGVDAAANQGLFITGNGALSYTDENGSPVTAPSTALQIYSMGDSNAAPGSITINTTGALTGGGYGIYAFNAGSGIVDITANGDVVGSGHSGGGILARNFGGTDLKITTGAGTKVSGGTYGIFVDNYSSIAGAVTVSIHGDVYGGTAIRARNYGTDLTVTTDVGTTVQGIQGISANNYGSGALEIKALGDVKGSFGSGIAALGIGGTDVSVITGANSTVSGEHGITAFNIDGADVTVTTGDNSIVTGDTSGILAENYGGGKTIVKTLGDVTGNTSYGIQARQYYGTGDLTITTGAGTRTYGATAGIYANTVASGALTITANGDVIGNLQGIISLFRSTSSDVTITTVAGTRVEGANGIRATGNGSGKTTINVNGDVVGGTDAIFVSGNNSAITVNVTETGSVTSNGLAADDFAIDISRGSAAIIVAGTVNGGAGGAIQFDSNVAKSGWLELHSTAVVNGAVLAGGSSNDSFVLGGTSNGTFDVGGIGAGQQYQGFEVFIKNGTSTWTLTGANSGVPTWIVNEGRLNVNADMANTAFALSSSTLGGTGVIGSLAAGRGSTVAPGNSIGTLTAMGDAIFGSGSTFEVEVNAAGDSDLLVVNGAVDLTGAILNVIADAGNYALATSYLIIDNDGTDAVVGAFASMATNLAFLTPTVSYTADTGNDVVLTLTRNDIDFAAVAQTRNQGAVAGALDTLPAGDPLVTALTGQTSAGARQAFDALSGEIHASVGSAMADDTRYVREAITGRLIQAYYGGVETSGGKPIVMAAAAPTDVVEMDASSRMSLGAGYGASRDAAPVDHDLTWWSRAFGSWGQYDSNGNAATTDRNLGGFVTGVDGNMGSGWRAGLTAGYINTHLTAGDERYSSADINSYVLGVYAGGGIGQFALRSGGTWTWNSIDTDRSVVFPGFFEGENASYSGDVGQLFAEVGYPIFTRGGVIEPFAGLAYVHLRTDSFTESGAIAGLTSGGLNMNLGYGTLGARASTTVVWGGTTMIPHVSAAWQYAFGDTTPEIAMAFASTGTGMGIAGVPVAQNSALLDIGADAVIAHDMTLGLSYMGQYSGDLTDNGLRGRFNWRF